MNGREIAGSASLPLIDVLLRTAESGARRIVGRPLFASVLIVGSVQDDDGRRVDVVPLPCPGGMFPSDAAARQRVLDKVAATLRDFAASAAVLVAEIESVRGATDGAQFLGAYAIEPERVRLFLAPISRGDATPNGDRIITALGSFEPYSGALRDARVLHLREAVREANA